MTKYVYDPETLMYEPQDEPKAHRIVRRLLLALLAFGLAAVYLWLYLFVFKFDLPKTSILQKQHARWEAKMEVLDRRVDLYESTLEAIEERDDEIYRSLYGLGEIPQQIRLAGLAGTGRYDELDKSGANLDLRNTVRRVDGLMKRADILSRSLDEVGVIARQAGDMISCVPSVPPLYPDLRKVRLTSSFGYRSDPVYGGGEYHTGQDMATDRGTPVYATGDGVVESCEYRFNGYGNEIVIDHGYGYQTRYAHLQSTNVLAGMKVKRGEMIGTVGSTGKSTGSHLHYEVMYRGNRVDPMSFMDINIPLDEYKAMISKVAEESVKGKRLSTSDIILRTR